MKHLTVVVRVVNDTIMPLCLLLTLVLSTMIDCMLIPQFNYLFVFYFPTILRVLSQTTRLLEIDSCRSSMHHEPTCVLNKYGGGYGRSQQRPIKNCIPTNNNQEKRKPGKGLYKSGSYKLGVNSYFQTVFTQKKNKWLRSLISLVPRLYMLPVYGNTSSCLPV
jgi:hypothetical protein